MTTETAIVSTGSTALAPQRYTSADQNPVRVYLASLAPGSKRTMEQALEVIANLATPGTPADTFPWGALRYQHTQAIRAALASRYDAATANKMLSALRQVLKAAWRLGQFRPTPKEIQDAKANDAPVPSGSDLYMAAADIANVKGEKPDQAAGHALTLGDIMALVGTCTDGTNAGARDAAILAVAYAGGLRRAEIVGLTLANFDAPNGVLTVKGKRNKSRTVPLQNGALTAVNDWLDVRGKAPGALFLAVGKGDRITKHWVRLDAERNEFVSCEPTDDGAMLDGMTTQAVYYIFTERAKAAKVDASVNDNYIYASTTITNAYSAVADTSLDRVGVRAVCCAS
ncbi:MAG: tyrosine-type recombinase/integrase [Caldilineaceae bacterium]